MESVRRDPRSGPPRVVALVIPGLDDLRRRWQLTLGSVTNLLDNVGDTGIELDLTHNLFNLLLSLFARPVDEIRDQRAETRVVRDSFLVDGDGANLTIGVHIDVHTTFSKCSVAVTECVGQPIHLRGQRLGVTERT